MNFNLAKLFFLEFIIKIKFLVKNILNAIIYYKFTLPTVGLRSQNSNHYTNEVYEKKKV